MLLHNEYNIKSCFCLGKLGFGSLRGTLGVRSALSWIRRFERQVHITPTHVWVRKCQITEADCSNLLAFSKLVAFLKSEWGYWRQSKSPLHQRTGGESWGTLKSARRVIRRLLNLCRPQIHWTGAVSQPPWLGLFISLSMCYVRFYASFTAVSISFFSSVTKSAWYDL